jgi:trk system potassium uptake protein TrkH
MAWSEALVEAPVLAATAQTTTGFSRLAPDALDGASKLLVGGAMLVGGGIGSTAGGVKLLRLLLLLRAIQVLVARTCLPQHAVTGTWLGGRPVEDAELREALLVILLFVLALGLSWLPFVAAGHDPLDALFDVASALGTVGLSTGVVGPDLEGYLKGVLCADMLLGRLEIVAWLVILYPRTWIGRRR